MINQKKINRPSIETKMAAVKAISSGLVTREEVAKNLGVSLKAVSTWIFKARKAAGVKTGKQKISFEEVLAHSVTQEPEPKAAPSPEPQKKQVPLWNPTDDAMSEAKSVARDCESVHLSANSVNEDSNAAINAILELLEEVLAKLDRSFESIKEKRRIVKRSIDELTVK